MDKDEAPSYLIDLFPNRIDYIVAYNLRNWNDIGIPFSGYYENSYYTSALKQLIELDPQIRRVLITI